MTRTLVALTALFWATASIAHDNDTQTHRALLGFVEWVTIEPVGLRLKARLDTGARTSSLHSKDVEPFERGGERWVRFRVPIDANRHGGAALTLERPIERVVLIKRKGAAPQRRYVVELPICIDGRRHETEFSLTDRENFLYPVLLGRRFLADVALVDSADSFLAKKKCPYTPPAELARSVSDQDQAE